MPRNGSGTAIPPVTVNPVSPGTTITSNWANTTVTDTYNELTNSLPRDGQAPMTAPLKIVDGSASVPGLSFNSATSSGLFRPASNTLAVTVSGVEATRWTSNGAVLIGQTSDDGINKLQVTGGAKITGAVSSDSVALALGTVALPSLAFAGDLNTGIYSPGADQLSVSTGGVARVAVGATGNVGMPTVDTVARLRADISDPSRGIVTVLRNSASTTGAQVQLSQNGIGDWAFGIVPATNAFAFYSGRTVAADGTERMRLDASGNLGLGGTSGGERLSVFGNARIAGGSGTVASLVLTGGNSNFQFNHTSGSGVAQIANTGGVLAFAAGGLTSRMFLDGSGNFQLGPVTTAATDAAVVRNTSAASLGLYRDLDVTSAGAAASILSLGALNGSTQTAGAQIAGVLNNPATTGYLAFYTRDSGSLAERCRLTNAGSLILNRTVDSGLGILQVNGNADFAPSSGLAQLALRAPVSQPAYIETTGSGGTAGATSMTYGQDASNNGYCWNRANASVFFGTNATTRMTLSPTGALTPQTDIGQNFGGAANRWATVFTNDVSFGVNSTSLSWSGGTVYVGAGTGWTQVNVRPGGTDRLVVLNDGRVYGTALHNNANAVTGTASQYIASGTYTPTFANVSNVSSFTGISAANWIRVGNVVHVAGAVTADFTTSGLTTNWTATLPIASGVLNGDLHGVAASNTQTDSTATIFNGTNVALFAVSSPANNGLHVYRYMFTYEVV